MTGSRRHSPAEPTGSGPDGRPEHVAAVLARARKGGLISNKDRRISGRVSSELIERAKARTGIRSDAKLVEFALANVAIEDDFVRVFREMRGTVDPNLDLEFRCSVRVEMTDL